MAVVAVALAARAIQALYPVSLEERRIALIEVVAVEIFRSATVLWTHMRAQKTSVEHFLPHGQYITPFLSQAGAAAQYKMRAPSQALATAQSSMRKVVSVVEARMDVAASQTLFSALGFFRMARAIR
jgi:hypothetical protein